MRTRENLVCSVRISDVCISIQGPFSIAVIVIHYVYCLLVIPASPFPTPSSNLTSRRTLI